MARANWPLKVVCHALQMPWTVLFGALVGFALAPASHTWWLTGLRYYDEVKPVVRMSSRLLAHDGDGILVTFSGEKLRACIYLRIQAYTVMPEGALEDAYIRRADLPERGDTKPLGVYSLGTWRIWPVSGAKGVLIYVQHDCDGRLVQTRIGHIDFGEVQP